MEAEQPLINTGVLAQSPTQFAQLWSLREGLTESVSKEGKAYKYDITVPLASFKDVIDQTREHLRSKGVFHSKAVKNVIGYGHVGDGEPPHHHTPSSTDMQPGNLHLNVIADSYTPEIEAALEPFVYELVGGFRDCCILAFCFLHTRNSTAKYKGSVSAEHGIGVHKTHALHYTKSATSIEWMKKIKHLFDPHGIMNPGKVLV